jgi:hypothetical protein
VALAALDKLLDTQTDAQAAQALNAAGHRSGMGRPFTGPIVLHLRRANGLPSHKQRLRAAGKPTAAELAERFGVHMKTIPQTPARTGSALATRCTPDEEVHTESGSGALSASNTYTYSPATALAP